MPLPGSNGSPGRGKLTREIPESTRALALPGRLHHIDWRAAAAAGPPTMRRIVFTVLVLIGAYLVISALPAILRA